MTRLASYCLSAAMVLCAMSSSASAATLTRIFALRIDTITNDFFGIGPAPTNLLLVAGIDDGGGFSDLRLFDGAISNNFLLGPGLDLGAAGWSVGNGPVDTFTFNGLQSGGTNRLLSFTVNNQASTVNDTNTTVANADALLREPAVLGGSFTFNSLVTGLGYSGTILAVPEPSSMAVLFGVVSCAGFIRRRRQS